MPILAQWYQIMIKEVQLIARALGESHFNMGYTHTTSMSSLIVAYM